MIYWRRMSEEMNRKEESVFAKALLQDALKIEYAMDELPEIQKKQSGKPFFPEYPDIRFNYSHSKSAAACILSDREVGIDLEDVRRYSEKTARHFCNRKEWDWLQKQQEKDKSWIRIWTIKEAYLKYAGTGIRTDLRELDVYSILKAGEAGQILEQENQVYVQSFFVENAWLTVCGFFKETKTICCI